MALAVIFALQLFTVVMGFQNPIIPGFNPDPSIVRTGEDYFLVTSTFEYFPGVPIYHSNDLIKWNVIGHALNRPSQLDLRGTAPSGGVFAPTLRFNTRTQKYYLVTTVFNIINPPDNTTIIPRSFYVSTSTIFDQNSWSDPVYLDQHGFDGDLFFDDDGKTYFTSTFGSRDLGYPDSGYFALWTTEIDLETGDSLTESRFTHQSPLPMDAPRLTEGAHIFKKDGKYHMITADGGTQSAHRVMHYRSNSVYGPWEANPQNPLLYNGRDSSLSITATGHADLVQTPSGDWFVVFLATRPQNPINSSGLPQLGRETFLAPARWTEDGWLIINEGKDVSLEMSGLYEIERGKIWRDDFKGAFTDLRWYTQRTPYKSFHKFVEGGLRLRGNVYTLSDRDTSAAFFRKQESLNTIFSTQLSFLPTSTRHEAGATVFLSIWFHNEVGITLHPETNARSIVIRTRSGPEATPNTSYVGIPETGKVTLFIKAEPDKYSLGFALENGNVTYISSVESRWLQSFPSGWQNFVGAHFGLYSTGNQLPTLVPADFTYAQTEEQ